MENISIIKKAVPKDDDAPDSDESTPVVVPAKRKQRAGGRTPTGEDFWALVDAWFLEKVKALGTNLAGPQWKE